MANLAYVVRMLRALKKLVTAFHDFSLLHPLSRFPGPKISPATISNEALFELLKAGRLTWEIREIHKEIQLIPLSLHSFIILSWITLTASIVSPLGLTHICYHELQVYDKSRNEVIVLSSCIFLSVYVVTYRRLLPYYFIVDPIACKHMPAVKFGPVRLCEHHLKCGIYMPFQLGEGIIIFTVSQ
jgi:hypothetical protein